MWIKVALVQEIDPIQPPNQVNNYNGLPMVKEEVVICLLLLGPRDMMIRSVSSSCYS